MNSTNAFAINSLLTRLKANGYNKDFLATAIYTRKSSIDKSEMSIQSQQEACSNFVDRYDKLKTYRYYSDENRSGSFMDNREDFNKLMEDVKKGLIHVIVAYDTSRISRSRSDSIEIDKILAEHNVIVLYTSQTFENNAAGHLVRDVVRSMDAYKSESTSETVARTQLAKAKALKFNGGTVPYGYKIKRKRYVVNEEEAVVIRLIFQKFTENLTVPQIISHLTASGYRTREGKQFNQNSIWYILRNVRYAGTYLYNSSDSRKRKYRVAKDDFEEVRVENAFTGIVDKKTFDKVQALLNTGRSRKSSNAKTSYPLKGFLVCGDCGKYLHGEVSYGGSGRNQYHRYTCQRNKKCKTSIKKETIERATANVLAQLLNEYANNKQVMLFAKKVLRKSLVDESRNVKGAITKENIRIKDCALSLGRTEDPETIEIINEEIQLLKASRDKLSARDVELNACLQKIDKFLMELDKEKASLLTADTILHNEEIFIKLLNLFVDSITVSNSKITFKFKQLK